MQNIYYKNVTPRVAKNRIAKLVERSNKAFEEFEEIGKYADENSFVYKSLQAKAVYYLEALDIMGIKKYKWFVD